MTHVVLPYQNYYQGTCFHETLFDICFSNIVLPVLPRALQIMADQGFEHNLPVLVLPKANQAQVSKMMHR